MAWHGVLTRPRALPSPKVQVTIWCLAAAVTVALYAAFSGPLTTPAIGWTSFGVLVLLALAAARQDVWAQVRTDDRDVQEMVDLDEVAIIVVMVLLEPAWAAIVSISTYGVVLISARCPALKTTFNIATRTATVGLAIALAAPYTTPPVAELTPFTAAIVGGAVLLHVVLNFLSVKTVVAAATGSGLRRTMRTTAGLNVVMWLGNASLGLAAAALWLHHPALIVVAAVLATVVRRAYHTVVVVNDLADELGLERDRLRQLVDGARDGILQLDAAGCVRVWNPALEELTGIEADDAVGQHVDALLGAQVHIVAGPPTIGAAVLGIGAPDDQLLVVDTLGEERSLVLRHALQRDRDDEVIGDIIQLHDRTAMERTARVEHDFLARVTHELLTPLTVIRGVAQTVLGRDELAATVRHDLLERLHRNAVQMEGLVNDLLAVNAGRRPRSAEPTDPVDLWAIIKAATATEGEAWAGRTIELRGGSVEGLVDAAAFHTVVRHLVRNALNYSPDDAAVTVTLEQPEPGTALLEVHDAGRGIPRARIDEMFAPFTRIEDPLRMETRGIGLGLFLVRTLISEMDGRVRVRSVPGQGSTFEVRVPCVARVVTHSER